LLPFSKECLRASVAVAVLLLLFSGLTAGLLMADLAAVAQMFTLQRH
jgi:hypothetical protein